MHSSKGQLVPYIPMLKESNVRKGFFEYHEYMALKDACPQMIEPIVTFAFHSGWRKNEILGLTWDRVDLKERVVRIDPGETKNEEGREFYMNEELLTEMQSLHSNRRLGCPYVFHREGSPIKDFRGSWDAACIKAGLFEIVRDEKRNETKVPGQDFPRFQENSDKRHDPVRNSRKSGHEDIGAQNPERL